MKCCQDIKVSIIMPSLNVAPYIRECIESAINQSLNDIEIICIDAGSTDGTREIIVEYAKKDNRIRFIDSRIKSYGHQVNIGINAAKGEYITILETDDYVDTTMYEKLYTIASANNLDYVKADYDSFIEYNSIKLFNHIQIFNDNNKYNRVIDCCQLPEIFVTDQNIWRGIYKRDFLNKSDIRLNESPGAAYQDIGFVLLVMTYAKRAMYINDSFYRYRMQREGCSSCSDKILQFSYQEFVRLIDELHIDNTDTFKHIVQRMTGVFLVEYTKLLTKCSFAFDKEYYDTYIDKYYVWFKGKLSEYMLKGIITEADMNKTDWDELNLLISSQAEFASLKKAQFEKREEYINQVIELINNRDVVIVSAGVWGKKAFDILQQRGVRIISFADNNQKLFDTYIGGIKVLPVGKCVGLHRTAVYIIANKRHEDELIQQLIDLDISNDNIISFRL